jgi:hypothetical protein
MERRTARWFAVLVALTLTVAGLLLVPAASADTGTCTTVVSKDSWTDEKTPTATHGTENVLRAGIKNRNRRYPHVAFGVTCLPTGASITAARVEFTPRITINQTNLRVWKSASATWGETTLNWNNQPGTVASSNTPGDSTHTAGVPETYELPAAGLPTGNGLVAYQIREVATGPNPEVEFHSKEQGTNAPRLLIDWSTPGTTTTTSTTTTTTLPPPNCTLASAYPSPQAAVDATPSGGCVELDGNFQLTSELAVNKPLRVQCSASGRGLFATSGTINLIRISSSQVTVDGCQLVGSGASGTITAVNFLGSISDVLLSHLTIHDVRTGTIGDSGVQHDIEVSDSLLEDIGGTGTAWYYGQESYNIRLLRNTYRRTQRLGGTGQAAIQSGGSPQLRHHNWTIQGNTVENLTCSAGDLVDIGLDQITDTVIDHNVVRHCNSWGEGIVVNGPRNQITWNEVYGVRNGSITLISYPDVGAQAHNITVADNTVVGPNLDGGQALALSHAGSDFRGLRVLRNTFSGHPWLIQAYAYQGPVMAGADNLIQDNNLTGFMPGGGPCSLPSPFTYTSVNNNPSC